MQRTLNTWLEPVCWLVTAIRCFALTRLSLKFHCCVSSKPRTNDQKAVKETQQWNFSNKEKRETAGCWWMHSCGVRHGPGRSEDGSGFPHRSCWIIVSSPCLQTILALTQSCCSVFCSSLVLLMFFLRFQILCSEYVHVYPTARLSSLELSHSFHHKPKQCQICGVEGRLCLEIWSISLLFLAEKIGLFYTAVMLRLDYGRSLCMVPP